MFSSGAWRMAVQEPTRLEDMVPLAWTVPSCGPHAVVVCYLFRVNARASGCNAPISRPDSIGTK